METFRANSNGDPSEWRLRASLLGALDDLLIEDALADAYYFLAYTDQALSDISRCLGLTFHAVNSRLLQPLCNRLAQVAGDSEGGRARICPIMRGVLAAIFPLQEFMHRSQPPRRCSRVQTSMECHGGPPHRGNDSNNPAAEW